ncbi:peptide deformylase [Candidatus Providencia siddallii]|uniref:Peptide deformylase n=1 Tax=Candidatus Providencia siddallii TaxID=1715285 RepID=A0ABM9NNR4_9GAMM
MSNLNILSYPDKRLRIIAKHINKVNIKIQRIIDEMINIMYEKKGIGLAATQVNVHHRIFVINNTELSEKNNIFINPEILNRSGEIYIKEGCLSIPNQYAFILRSKHIKVRALNYNGNLFEIEANDLLAVCIQHEIDHLFGKLFIDYLSFLKRQRICKKLKKIDKFKNIILN